MVGFEGYFWRFGVHFDKQIQIHDLIISSLLMLYLFGSFFLLRNSNAAVACLLLTGLSTSFKSVSYEEFHGFRWRWARWRGWRVWETAKWAPTRKRHEAFLETDGGSSAWASTTRLRHLPSPQHVV
ncbi:unnamed protein product [Polarella glacialis]|uniref:Uncharacterized protein n=1 Tax=Polarella glacialis TaxID=89957 RepID=A0A813HC94_POLGL|nr:unnamed protein product [Polarella glacialis]